jgi:small subunit ribosomal protein S9
MVTKAPERYIEAIGRRKRAVARVRITASTKDSLLVNGRDMAGYFPTAQLQKVAHDAFSHAALPEKFTVTAHINGGGVSSQANALRLGIARALIVFNPELRKTLKHEGFLKRDPRKKERKKFGLKKARKAPQWSKR